MRVYLDNCCYNRPFDPQTDLRIHLEAVAKVRVQTLMNWCRPFHKELEALGMQRNMKVLPPNIVKFIAEKFAIDV
jgi:hypothetical protein